MRIKGYQAYESLMFWRGRLKAKEKAKLPQHNFQVYKPYNRKRATKLLESLTTSCGPYLVLLSQESQFLPIYVISASIRNTNFNFSDKRTWYHCTTLMR